MFSYVTVNELDEYRDTREILMAWGRMRQYTSNVLPWLRVCSWFPYFIGGAVEPERRWQFIAMALLAQSGDPITWFFYDKAMDELRTLRMHSAILNDWALPDHVLTQNLIMRWSTWSVLRSAGPLVVAWFGLEYIQEYVAEPGQDKQAQAPGAAAAQGPDGAGAPGGRYPTPPAAAGALDGAAAPGAGLGVAAAPGAGLGGAVAPGAGLGGAALVGPGLGAAARQRAGTWPQRAGSQRAASSPAASSSQGSDQDQDQDLDWLP